MLRWHVAVRKLYNTIKQEDGLKHIKIFYIFDKIVILTPMVCVSFPVVLRRPISNVEQSVGGNSAK